MKNRIIASLTLRKIINYRSNFYRYSNSEVILVYLIKEDIFIFEDDTIEIGRIRVR